MMGKEVRILIVEDEPDYRRLLKEHLTSEGFEVGVAETGEVAHAMVRREPPDLLLLDLYLPGMSGFDLCDKLKAEEATRVVPILVMTAFDDPKKDIACLEHGAEGYLIKPIEPERLTAYIRSILRRRHPGPKDQAPFPNLVAIEDEKLRLDYANKIVEFEGGKINDLTPKEYEILWQLVVNRPNSIPRDTLYRMVWGQTRKDKQYKTVDVHVHRVREKLFPKLAKRIRYVTGRGYCFSGNP